MKQRSIESIAFIWINRIHLNQSHSSESIAFIWINRIHLNQSHSSESIAFIWINRIHLNQSHSSESIAFIWINRIHRSKVGVVSDEMFHNDEVDCSGHYSDHVLCPTDGQSIHATIHIMAPSIKTWSSSFHHIHDLFDPWPSLHMADQWSCSVDLGLIFKLSSHDWCIVHPVTPSLLITPMSSLSPHHPPFDPCQ